MKTLKENLYLLLSITFCLNLNIQQCFSQVIGTPADVSAKLGSASSAGAVGGAKSVSDYFSTDKSGDMSLSVPLVTIKSRKMSLPVNANYRAGVKVNQKSSEIGLGWSISVGSITRDFGMYEPDYTSTRAEAEMYYWTGTAPVLNNKLDGIQPGGHYGMQLHYDGIGTNQVTPDDYILNVPMLGGNAFWNSAAENANTPTFEWSEQIPWKVDYTTKTFEVPQEFSRINEVNFNNSAIGNNGQDYLKNEYSFAAAIGVLPYVKNGAAAKLVTSTGASGPGFASNKVYYEDYASWIITADDGTRYVFSKALREQKYIFPEAPFWTVLEDNPAGCFGGSLNGCRFGGEWWKTDFIREWLLTAVLSPDYIDSNNNNIPDEADAGDWIRIEYTGDVVAVTEDYYLDENQQTFFPQNIAKYDVQNYREWLNYNQTDKASSLFRERAYITKIVTPLQTVDFTTSEKFDIDHDYFETPANYKDLHDYVWKDLGFGASNTVQNAFKIDFPVEVQKYDEIKIKNTKNLALQQTIKFNYADHGSADELCVSDYSIRDWDNVETPVDIEKNPNDFVLDNDIEGIELNANAPNGNIKHKRGKTTLLSIDFFNRTSSEKLTYKFEYGFNPSFSEIHKREIIRSRVFPVTRQSCTVQEPTKIQFPGASPSSQLPLNTADYPFLSILPYKSIANYYNFITPAQADLYVQFCAVAPGCSIVQDEITNFTHTFSDEMGYYYQAGSSNSEGRDAWSLTKMIIPEGGSIQFNYERDQFDYDGDKINWSFTESNIPTIQQYNEIAYDRCIRQMALYRKQNQPPNPKEITRRFEMNMNEYSGGLRLKNIMVNDDNGNIQQTSYEYGTGHHPAIPASYWSCLQSAWSDFLFEENNRHIWEEPYKYELYYKTLFEGNNVANDFQQYMSSHTVSMRLDNSLTDNHYYDYIDIINSDGSKIRNSYGDPLMPPQRFYNRQDVVMLKGYTGSTLFKTKLCGVLQKAEPEHDIALLKTEHYNSSSVLIKKKSNNYSLDNFSITPVDFNAVEVYPAAIYPVWEKNANGIFEDYSVCGFTSGLLTLSVPSAYPIKKSIRRRLTMETVIEDGIKSDFYSISTNTPNDYYIDKKYFGNSDGTLYLEITRRPDHISTGFGLAGTDEMIYALGAMKQRNMLSLPLEIYKSRSVGDFPIESKLTLYKRFTLPDLQIYPSALYQIPKSENTIQMTPAFHQATPQGVPSYFTMDNRYKKLVTYDRYDRYGNLLQETYLYGMTSTELEEFGKPVSFQYDSRGVNLLATFENGRYNNAEIGDECSFTGFEEGKTEPAATVEDDYWNYDPDANSRAPLSTIDPHTGNYCQKLTAANNSQDLTFSAGKLFLPTNQKQEFKFSAWIKASSQFDQQLGELWLVMQIKHENGDDFLNASQSNIGYHYTPVSIDVPNTWNYFEVVVNLAKFKADNEHLLTDPNEKLQLQCYIVNYNTGTDFYVDDFRVQPYLSKCISFTHDAIFNKIGSASNNNSIPVYSEYDEFGRNEWALDENKNVLNRTQYYYHDAQILGNRNFIKTTTFTKEHTKNDVINNPSSINFDDYIINKVFTDGIGRTLQNISQSQSPSRYDIISFYEYDSRGRQPTQYLPYTSGVQSGSYRVNARNDQAYYYQNAAKVAHDNYPYSTTQFESTPESKVSSVMGVGEDWTAANNPTVFEHGSNGASEILLWKSTSSGATAMKNGNPDYFDSNALFRKRVVDEEGVTSDVFTDIAGKVICKRRYVNMANDLIDGTPYCTYDFTNGQGGDIYSYQTEVLYTYYVYNESGMPLYELSSDVIQSMSGSYEFTTSDIVFNESIYATEYDNIGRVSRKKSPGAGWTTYIYDKLNRVVMSQDAKQAVNHDWYYKKYDVLGREIMSGIYHDENQTNDNLKATFVLTSTPVHENCLRDQLIIPYTNRVYPLVDAQVLTINYYDNYVFDDGGFNFETNNLVIDHNHYNNGTSTGSRIAILGTTPVEYLLNVNYYDKKLRLVQTVKQNILSGSDRISSEINFGGQLTRSERKHTSSKFTGDLVIKNRFNYDHAGRPLSVFQQTGINDPEMCIVNFEYNENGQLVRKNLHSDVGLTSNSWLQSIDYRYNIRGWLRKINNPTLIVDFDNPDANDVFGQELIYSHSDMNATGISISGFDNLSLYNGNIALNRWKTKAPEIDGSTVEEHLYAYRYDQLNRMTAAYFAANTVGNPLVFDQSVHAFNEKLTYLQNNNIHKLDRNYNGSPIDQLSYSYSSGGYQVKAIADNVFSSIGEDFRNQIDDVEEFFYDENGNIVQDNNKQTSTSYNFLNLPETILRAPDYIMNIYDALGNKLKSKLNQSENYYIDGIEYNNTDLLFALTPAGRVRPKHAGALNTTEYVYDYFIKDYAENIRAVVTEEYGFNSHRATMELSNDQSERDNFYFITETREDAPNPIAQEPLIEDKVSMLNKLSGKTVGHSKILPLIQGDKVSLDVQSFYESANANYSGSAVIPDVINQLAGMFFSQTTQLNLNEGGIPPDLNSTQQLFAGNTVLNSWLDNQLTVISGKPAAFLIYIYLNKKFQLEESSSGVLRVENADQIEKLEMLNIEAPQDGYMFIYVSNESNTNVSFDNLDVRHMQGQLMEINEYYPYGMRIDALSSFSGIRHPLNKYKFTSKEYVTDAELYEYDFGARSYDPAIARWRVQDPASQFANPYMGIGNNPVGSIDPDGRWIIPAVIGPKKMLSTGLDIISIPARFGSGLNSMLEDKINGNEQRQNYFSKNYILHAESPYYSVWGMEHNVNHPFYNHVGDYDYLSAAYDSYQSQRIDDFISFDIIGMINERIKRQETTIYIPIPIEVKPESPSGGGPVVACNDCAGFMEDGDPEKQNQTSSTTQPEEGSNVLEHILGPILYAAGQPLNVLKPVGALGSAPGSSLASATFRMVPGTFTKVLGKKTGQQVVKKIGTNSIGAALGRFTPVVGLIFTAYDVTRYVAIPMSLGVQDYTKTYQNSGLIYHVK